MTDLSKYLKDIISEHDKTLFNEAAVSAVNGAPRGAYILLWLSAAESLKRKFKEASLRDAKAGQITGEIQTAEDNHKSVDLLILKRAKEYGFIDDTAFQKLEHIYNLRCLYGHPYETAPSAIELLSAAEVIVNEVLSKPTVLKKGYVNRLIEQLSTDINFLELSKEGVVTFAVEIADKIDPSVHAYLVERYFEKLEETFDDASLQDINNRGKWFLIGFIGKVGTSFYNSTQWHDFCSRFPKTAQAVLAYNKDTFTSIGTRARDYIISYLLTESDEKPSYLRKVEKMYDNSLLKASQATRLKEVDITEALSAKLKVTTVFDTVIYAFKSHNWYKQNPAALLVKSTDRANLLELSEENQIILGRNILQAAHGSSGETNGLLDSFVDDQSNLSRHLIKGISFECFVNEKNEFRLKVLPTGKALKLLKNKQDLVEELSLLISSSTPSGFTSSGDFDLVLSAVEEEPELAALAQTLRDNRDRLITTPDF